MSLPGVFGKHIGSCTRNSSHSVRMTPRHNPAEAEAIQKAMNRAHSGNGHVRRRVWDLTPFGYELDMLLLRFCTLAPVVDFFLVTEATTTHTNNVRKPLVLSDAIANESIPTDLRRKVSVRVVDFAVERERFCPVGMPGKTFRCLEALQRFVLLEMLLGDARASPRDLAIIADVDEIVRPSVVSMLRRCYPWDEDGSGLPGSIILRMTLFKYGVHCDLGNTFMFGARAYSVGHLARSYSHAANASAASLHEKSMGLTGTRDHQIGPVIDDAGWHLTSFGSASELAHKLRTFLHSNIFVHRSTRATALDPGRLERCMRFCLDLSQPRTANGSMPPCAGRDDPKSRRLPGRVHARMSARLDLPPPLLRPQEREHWPPLWFRFIRV